MKQVLVRIVTQRSLMVMVVIMGTVTHGYIPDNGPILYPAHKNVWSTHPLDKSVGMIHAARGTRHVASYGPGSNCVPLVVWRYMAAPTGPA